MRMVLSAILALGLVTGVTAQDEEKEEPKTESEDGVKDVIKKAADYKNYTYTSKSETEGMPNRGGGGGGGGGQGGGGGTEGKYSKDDGLVGKAGRTEFVKIGDDIAYKQGEEWKKYEEQQGGGGGRGGRGGRATRALRNLKAPHEDLAALADYIDKEEDAEKDGDNTVYAVTLTEEGIEKLSPFGRFLSRLEDPETSGSAKVWVDGDGQIVKYEIKTELKAEMRGNELELTNTKTVEISDIGKTEVEIPEGAKEVLDE